MIKHFTSLDYKRQQNPTFIISAENKPIPPNRKTFDQMVEKKSTYKSIIQKPFIKAPLREQFKIITKEYNIYPFLRNTPPIVKSNFKKIIYYNCGKFEYIRSNF